MKKLLLVMFLMLSSSIIFSQTLNQPSQFNNVCDDNNDGIATFYMQEIAFEIIGNNTNLVVTHHETLTNANVGANPLPATYVNITNPQTIYARVVNTATSQVQIVTYSLHVNPVPIVGTQTLTGCLNSQCWNLTSIIPNVSNGAACTVAFYITQSDAMAHVNAIPNPTCYVSFVTTPTIPPLYFSVNCNPQANCFAVGTLLLVPTTCYTGGQPQNLTACSDTPNLTCFDLTVNNSAILGNLDPATNTVTYHATQANAAAGVNALASPFCPTASSVTLFSRVASNVGNNSDIRTFTITSVTFQTGTTLPTITQCDDNNNGVIIWNLTSVEAQLNTSNTLIYYPSLTAAQNMNGAVATPAVFSTNVSPNLISIFIREVVVGGCDIIHTVQLQGYANCNLASVCGLANSLCSSLGVPFSNTVAVPQTGPVGCLGSTPNPTWFYLPISTAGHIALTISQTANAGNPIDVDYIMYGPFTNPVTPCSNPSQLTGSIVSCSYSTAAVETPFIANPLPGQYYLLMVTNFSNQPGMITINQTNMGQLGSGTIDCTGLRLNAFLDANTNGVKDAGEQNFPLGQFHYEKNDNGIVHHITAPAGVYDIYDTNNTNSYDVSFTVDAGYASSYSVSPSSFSNLTVGAGLTSYYFPVTVLQPYNDLALTIVPLNAPRPGFTYQNKVVYTNFGSQTVASGTLTFNKDANVSITGNTQSGTTPTATGFTYNFANLAPFEIRTMTVTMQVPTIPTVAAGQFLTNTASIAPLTGDVLPENNASTSSQMIINAYDPNDKMESHGDRILHSTFTSNDYLYYTIRFENTGTASAINVRVNDVLDSQLDEATLQMVSASHAYNLDRVGNTLNWIFDDIQLPVSVPNTNIGKGYVTFKIKPMPGYAVGDIINNAASIYFDFNPAIVTNTFSTQFVATLELDQFSNNDFVFFPNPTSDVVTVSLTNNANAITSIVVYDVLGKVITTTKVADTATQTIDVSQLNSGIYFIEVTTDSNLKVVKKLMVK